MIRYKPKMGQRNNEILFSCEGKLQTTDNPSFIPKVISIDNFQKLIDFEFYISLLQ